MVNAAVNDIYTKNTRRSGFPFHRVVPQGRDICKWLRTCIAGHYLDYHLKRSPKAKKHNGQYVLDPLVSFKMLLLSNSKIGFYRNVVFDFFEQILEQELIW